MDKPKWWDSITNITLFVMIVSLAIMTCYSLVWSETDRFDDVFSTFTNIIIAICAFFFGKVTTEAANKKSLETEKNMKEAALSIPTADNTKTNSTVTTVTSTESPIKKK